MAISFNKKEVQKKKEQKRKEKQKRKEERKAGGGGSLDDMIAYVDENGVITTTPPNPVKKQEVEVESIAVSTPKKEEVEEPVLIGRVEFYNAGKGYGFIKNTAGTDKYFFHVSNAPVGIAEGDKVSFELERGEKGVNAVRIVLLQ
ncbi:MAG: cold shock domain-containing protein [Dysgonamonadaceae bacterium]|jgi:cold shock CspA family protein|nr:cold shock domain-containing protein [Dysgonamonadaceae bacterium]